MIHEPARLMIAATLYVVKEADFLYLQGQTDLTKGNLSSHLTKLEEAGYVEIEKTYRGKIPMTVCRLTKKGRASFKAYEAALRGALFEPANAAFGDQTLGGVDVRNDPNLEPTPSYTHMAKYTI
jgi:DNA-binding MarR family transcriptional regulator